MLLAHPLGQTVSAQEIISELDSRGYYRILEVITPTVPVTPEFVPVTPPESPPVVEEEKLPIEYEAPKRMPLVVSVENAVRFGVDAALRTLDTTKSYAKLVVSIVYRFIDPAEYDRIIGDAFNYTLNNYAAQGGDPNQFGSAYWMQQIRAEIMSRNIFRLTEPYPPLVVTPVVTPALTPAFTPVVIEPTTLPYEPYIPYFPEYVAPVEPSEEPTIWAAPQVPESIKEDFIQPEEITKFTYEELEPVLPEEIEPVVPAETFPFTEPTEPYIYYWREPEVPAYTPAYTPPVMPAFEIEEKPDRSKLFLLLFGVGFTLLAMREEKGKEEKGKKELPKLPERKGGR